MGSNAPRMSGRQLPSPRVLLLGLFGLSTAALFPSGVAAQARHDQPPPDTAQGRQTQDRVRLYDPTAGIDPDGRIERPPLADELPHPERWRFIPEGRIVPGSPFERLFQTSFIAPQFFAEPDIGVGGGLVLTDIDFRNQRRQEFAGVFLSYTTEGQQSYRMLWRRFTDHREVPEEQGGGVLQSERSFWFASAGYQRTLTRRFYGFGADSRSTDETSYTDELTSLALARQITLDQAAGDWIGHFGLQFDHHQLQRGRVSAVPSMDQSFPEVFARGDDQALLWLEGGIDWNTRDSLHNPNEGTTAGIGISFAPAQTSGDQGGLVGARFTHVQPIPSPFHDGREGDEESPPIDALAFGAFVSSTFGDLPFYAQPSLGGSNSLRGYINNRFTGDSVWHASAEYRFWFVPRGFPITRRIRVERLGAALFYDVGSVGNDLGDALSGTVRDSWGVGLRFALERLALFRVDVGVSDEDTNLTLSYGLPF